MTIDCLFVYYCQLLKLLLLIQIKLQFWHTHTHKKKKVLEILHEEVLVSMIKTRIFYCGFYLCAKPAVLWRKFFFNYQNVLDIVSYIYHILILSFFSSIISKCWKINQEKSTKFSLEKVYMKRAVQRVVHGKNIKAVVKCTNPNHITLCRCVKKLKSQKMLY